MISADERPAHEPDEQPLLNAGDVVGGRYVLTRVVGRGAAGTVWEAEHRLLTSRVALKFLDTAALLDPTSAEILAQRFRFEAQICARLAPSTKHLVSAHDAGMFRGVPYLVMELVDGETLDHRVTQARLSPEDVADMLDQLAEPIDAAHATGIAHRDIKPGNIMILQKGSNPPFYKLGDFGTAKTFGQGLVGLTPPKQTSENTLVGSPAYMSPEYISGMPLANGAIDIWALGVTAYEALTGRLPFDGEVWTQVAVAIVGGEFSPPSKVYEEIPERLDEVFTRAFAPEPADRYANAKHFARAFRQALTAPPKPVVVEPEEPIEIPTSKRRNTWVLAVVGLIALLAIVIGVKVAGSGDEVKPAETAIAEIAPTGTATAAPNPTPTVVATTAEADATATAIASETAAPAASSAPATQTPWKPGMKLRKREKADIQ